MLMLSGKQFFFWLGLLAISILPGSRVSASTESNDASNVTSEVISLDSDIKIKLKELAFGELLFDYYQQNYFAALTRLDVAEHKNEVVVHKQHLQLLRGVMYLNYGMLDSAQQIFSQILSDSDKSQVISQVRFYLAKTHYLNGQFDAAQSQLSNAALSSLPSLQQEAWLIQSQIAFETGDLASAEKYLLKVEAETKEGQFAQFNLAVFYLRQNQLEQAVKLFDNLYPNPKSNDIQRSLYDRANLALGYYFLENKQPEKAREHLLNVRLDSPFANRALLSLGWTYYESGTQDKAIAHWRELLKKDARDPAVQEASMALAFAYYRNGAKREALEAFVNSAALYGQQLNTIELAKQDIANNLFQQWLDDRGIFGDKVFERWGSGDVPITGNPIEYYLQETVSTNEFNQLFQRFQEMSHLQDVLVRWKRQIPVYKQMLANHEERYNNIAPRISANAQQLLNQNYKQQYQEYVNFAESRFADDDLWFLADEDQLELYQDLKRLKSTMDKIPASEMDLSDQQEQWRRVYGALMWQIAENYGPKKYRVTKQIKEAGEALEELSSRETSITQSKQVAATRFLNYDSRIFDLSSRIESSLRLIEQQKQFAKQAMQQILQQKLEKRKQELDFLLAQTELSIAKIQDEAINRLLEQNQ
ncbi:MAG: tetratricopeptide repeat protein [Gammaproteobacteria bacterium]|nr:tetratricopeptide repeat protein [Gammaproteobacteria bacterium]